MSAPKRLTEKRRAEIEARLEAAIPRDASGRPCIYIIDDGLDEDVPRSADRAMRRLLASHLETERRRTALGRGGPL